MALDSKPALVRLALLLILSLTLSRSTGEAANFRYFQMALFTYEFMAGGVNWLDVADYVDVPMFEGYLDSTHQPADPSIMRLTTWHHDQPFAAVNVDWSRVHAVVVDEPFAILIYHYNDPATVDEECTNQQREIATLRRKLVAAAAAVHEMAPQTRFWVNYSGKEVHVMRREICPLPLNDSAFDVVSVDIYQADFYDDIKEHYDWFLARPEQQQIALVPATHHKVGVDSDSQAAGRLRAFFRYANTLNRRCDRPLGRAGRTGNYDGCPVWIVAGWLAQPVFEDASVVHHGLLNGSSSTIRSVWSSELSKHRLVEPLQD